MALSFPFTPDVIDRLKCMARTWNEGRGGQCSSDPVDDCAGLCSCHSRQAQTTGLSHGRVNGPVPRTKLLAFGKASGVKIDPEVLKCRVQGLGFRVLVLWSKV